MDDNSTSQVLGQTSLAPRFDSFPADLRDRRQWVLWRTEQRDGDKPTKVPYRASGGKASTTDPNSWCTFQECRRVFARGGFDGVGFVFTPNDPFVGIDLDSCRDPETGEIDAWAREILEACHGTYAEISPSGTGVKLFGIGELPNGMGFNHKLPEHGSRGGKSAAFEVYDRRRYFAVTGAALPDADAEPCDVSEGLAYLLRLRDQDRRDDEWKPRPRHHYLPENDRRPVSDRHQLLERCRRYVDQMPEAVSGNGGHDRTFAVACVLFKFGLTDLEAAAELDAYNQRCSPPWSRKELEHKLRSARETVTRVGEFGTMGREVHRSTWTPTAGDVGSEETTSDEPTVESPAFARLISSAELLALDCRISYLIDDVLVEGQPCVVGGLSKTLKTGTTIDAAVSLATGTPFLGRFNAQRRRVAIWSGESGAATLRSLARRVCYARGVDLATADLLWSFDLPKLSRDDHLRALEKTIVRYGVQVAFIDPLYLALLDARTASQASNVYAMGAALLPLSEIGQRTGVTFVVLHHAKRSTATRDDSADVCPLEMLAQAGIVEWARQWLLLQRRSPYQDDGRHELWMRAGGSAGHSGLWALDVDEGKRTSLDPDSDGRYWQVDVRNPGDARQEGIDVRQEQRERAKQDKQAAQAADDVERLAKAMETYPEGQTLRVIRDAAGLSGGRAGKALATMLGTGHALACKVQKNGRDEDGFRYVKNPGSVGGTRWDSPTDSHPVPARWDGPCIQKGRSHRDVPPSHRTNSSDLVPPSPCDASGRVLSFDEFNDRGANS